MWDPAVRDLSARQPLQAPLGDVSFEATPGQILQQGEALRWLAPGSSVYVPFLPSGAFVDTIAACTRLVSLGLSPVPHIPARRIASVAQASCWLAELREAGCTALFLIAGDTGSHGAFRNTLELLDSGVLVSQGFHKVGVAGHPEGHPVASASELRAALRVKRDYALDTGTAMWVVTQFALRAEAITDWLDQYREELAPFAVYPGIAGPVGLSTLLKYARLCGVGTSLGALGRRPGLVSLAARWDPGLVLAGIRRYRERVPDAPIRGLHLFPFGGLRQSVVWLEQMAKE